MYPRVGQRVHVTGYWRGRAIDVVGVVMPSRRDPSSPAFRTRTGAVLAVIRHRDGKKVTIPWSTGVVQFETVEDEEDVQ